MPQRGHLRSAGRDGLPVSVECAGERMEALYTHLGFEKHAQAARHLAALGGR